MPEELIIDFGKENPERLKELIAMLAGRTRLEILHKISADKEWSVTDLSKEIGCGTSNMCQQATRLEKAGLIVRKTAKSIGKNIKIVKPVYKIITIKFGE